MTSIFQRSRQSIQEEPGEVSSVFKKIKEQKQEQIIPPIGIAKPELEKSFMENMDNEEKIRQDISEAEAYERETGFETAKRETGAHAARFTEGLFGGISSFLNAISPDLELEELSGEIEKHKPSKLPTSEDIREFTKEKTGNYLEPKNEKEKATQEIASDIGSMFSTPGLGFLQKVILPIGGQITKQIIKSSGGGEEAQELGKLGFMGLSTIAQLGNAPKMASRAYSSAEQMIPQGLRFSSQPIENVLGKIKNSNWFKSGTTPSKAPAMKEVARIEAQIQNGTIDAHMAMQLRRDINEARKELGGFRLFKADQPVDTKSARRYLDEVDKALMEGLENYGKNVDPKWFKNYKLANEAYAVTERSRALGDFIAKKAKPLQSSTAKTLFHVAGTTGALNIPLIATAAAPVAAAAKTIQIMNRMIRSPVLRIHYLDVLKSAATGNAGVMNKALEKFDSIANKLEKKQKD